MTHSQLFRPLEDVVVTSFELSPPPDTKPQEVPPELRAVIGTYTLAEPFQMLAGGVYRVDCDPETGIATVAYVEAEIADADRRT